jgi:hypothetical protein
MVAIFVAQFWWFFACWAVIARFAIEPWSRRRSVEEQLAMWVAPEMFRVLGLGLLQPTISPGMPHEFAIATALGDSITAVLAMAAFVTLRLGHRAGRKLAWLATVVGLCDLVFAFAHANHTGAMPHLHAQYFVPVFAGPIMLLAHLRCLRTLLRSHRQ